MKTLAERIDEATQNGKYPYFTKDLIIELMDLWLDENRDDIGNQIYSDHRVVAETVFDVLKSKLTVAGDKMQK